MNGSLLDPWTGQAYNLAMNLHPAFASLEFQDAYDWWTTEPLPVPFFGGKALPFTFEVDPAGGQWAQAQAAALKFLSLGQQAREKVSPAVLEDMRLNLEYVLDEDEVQAELDAVTSPEDLWAQVTPQEVVVLYPSEESEVPYVLVQTLPTWEQEHGMQLVLRLGYELVYVMPNEPFIPAPTDTEHHGLVSPPLNLLALL